MAYTLYEYVAKDGKNDFKEWRKRLDSTLRGHLDSKLDMLAKHGHDLPSGLLAPTKGNIKKLKVRAKLQLRPRVCVGPLHDDEYSLLLGVTKKDGKESPPNADKIAQAYRDEIATFGESRRTIHA